MKHLEDSSFLICFLLSNLSIQARRKQEKQNIPTTISLAKRHQLSQQLLDKQKNEIQKLKQKTDKVMLSSALTCIFVIMLQTISRYAAAFALRQLIDSINAQLVRSPIHSQYHQIRPHRSSPARPHRTPRRRRRPSSPWSASSSSRRPAVRPVPRLELH